MFVVTSRRKRALAFLIAAGIIASACAGPTSTTADAPNSSSGDVAAPLGDATAPDAASDAAGANAFLVDQFPTLTNQTLDLADFQNQDVVLWMWAPW